MFHLSIPLFGGQQHELTLEIGKVVFVLGPNGTGKSSLLQHLASQISDTRLFKWIRAHRRTWIASNMLDLTPAQMEEQQKAHMHFMRRPDARYLTHDDGYDTQSSIASLIQQQNANARRVKQLLMQDKDHDAKSLAREGDVLHTLNSALRQSHIEVTVSIGEKDDVIATRQGVNYGVNEMSDGERSVILLAASVLTADAGTLFFLDEPERHLYRAIVSPLLSTLFKARSDCAFVISTHEVDLPTDNPDSDVILVRECSFSRGTPQRWVLDVLDARQRIPEDVRYAILGARRKMVFVEGNRSSLDYPLYAQVLPGVSVVPVGGCRSVINAVKAIRSLADYHGVRAFGLVDRDCREESEVQRLEMEGVFVVDGCAVEAIYYDTEVARMVVERTAEPEEAYGRLERVCDRALGTLRKSAEQMCQSLVRARRREVAMAEIEKLGVEEGYLPLNGSEILKRERDRYEALLDAGDLSGLIRGYPIKKSPVLAEMARGLGFSSESTYEGAVVKLLVDDREALAYVRTRFKDLLAAIAGGES